MDNHMPNLSGIKTIHRIRTQLKLNTVIFACTADVFEQAHDQLIDAGADFVLTKPLQRSSLDTAIEKFSSHFNDKPRTTESGNVVELIRYPLEKLTLTEEEVSQSPLLTEMGFSKQEKINLLSSLDIELEAKSIRLIEAYTQSDILELQKLLHSINGMSVEFRMKEMARLSKTAEDLVKKEQLPNAELLQKLINLMNVNCHQTHRLLKSMQDVDHRVPPPETRRILVAEDNNVNIIVLTKLLNSMGFDQIDIAKTGEEAISYAKQHLYHVILMDNHMPVMTGIEATRIIKTQIAPLSNIIACTADATPEANKEFLDCGAVEVILKPIDKKKLISALKSIEDSLQLDNDEVENPNSG